MATNTDWSKFQRRYLHTLLRVQSEIGEGTSPSLEYEMEADDIERVMSVMRKSGTLKE